MPNDSMPVPHYPQSRGAPNPLKEDEIMSETKQPLEGEIIFYTTPAGVTRVEVFFQDDTFWLSQRRMSELFGVEVQTINYHLKEIYKSGELSEEATIRKIRIVQAEGSRQVAREVDFYNLDAIISVGYRVNSHEATQFRIWAITGQTAAELIASRADADKPNMGLTTWKNAPEGKILKSDVKIAKNYLAEKEIKELERIVSMYLDYAENQAARQIPMRMADWIQKLDAFLQFNEYEVLTNAGRVSHAVAKQLAEDIYSRFRVIQDQAFESDFEREVKQLTGKKE
jgi:hypothetical protein